MKPREQKKLGTIGFRLKYCEIRRLRRQARRDRVRVSSLLYQLLQVYLDACDTEEAWAKQCGQAVKQADHMLSMPLGERIARRLAAADRGAI